MACALCAGLYFCSAARAADGSDQRYDLKIEARDLGSAMAALIAQTDIQLLYPYQLAGMTGLNAVNGRYTLREALDIMFEGSGFSVGITEKGTVAVFFVEEKNGEGSMKKAELNRRLLAGAAAFLYGTGAYAQDIAVIDADAREEQPDSDDQRDEIVVTGTNIRGVRDQFSPVARIGRADMELAGNESLADLFDDLTQNFGGGIGQDMQVSTDGPGGAGVNLRGLGNESTLVLLNGRRMAPGGVRGSYVDVSTIPASVIDRVEIMSDGASAIYGSDAVAGVVNIILRDDYQGAESRLNLSTLTEGGAGTVKFGQTAGFSNDRVHALAAYEYAVEDGLDVKDKAYSEFKAADGPYFLLPFNQKHSIFSSGGVKLSDRVSLDFDGYYNTRKTKSYESSGTTAARTLFWEADFEQYGYAGGLNADLPKDWTGELSASASVNNHRSGSTHLAPTTSFGARADNQTKAITVDALFQGPVFSIGDEAVRAAFGGHFRKETADLNYVVALVSGDRTDLDLDQSRNVAAAFGELYAPLVSEASAIQGVRRLAVTAAARYERYSDVGSSFDPRVGLVWSLVDGLNLRGTWATSFRAPRLEQLRDIIQLAALVVYADSQIPGSEQTTLLVAGQSSDLKPEQAETWTAGVDFSPSRIEGLQLRGTYFDISYKGRIGVPSVRFTSDFVFTDFAGVLQLNPGADEVADYISMAGIFRNYSDIFPYPTLGPLSAENVTAIMDQRPQNLSRSAVSGFDLEARYAFGVGQGDLALSLNSTILTRFEQRADPLSPLDDILNTFGNPVDFRLRGGAQWRTAPLTASVFVNHIGGYSDNQALGADFPVQSWTTADASLRIDMGEALGTGIASGGFLTLSMSNIFDTRPPVIGARQMFDGTVYDRANADPSGRRIGLVLTKRW